MRSRFILLNIILLILWTAASCSNRDQVLSVQGAGGDGARTPDELVSGVAKAYVDRDLAAYADLLDEDFVFSMHPCDVNDLGKVLVKTMWGRDEELTIAGRMFGGKACRNSQGAMVPAVTSITVGHCERLTPWENAQEQGRPRVLKAVYKMHVDFTLQGDRVMAVDGPTTFYAAPVPGPQGGTIYKLRAWVDQG
ncbi:hypothetical protein CO151_00595 [bacterium CG_4_9_14_3_um_filter_65_15]|nr:MAG: hypothetical protein CO151_00595 [bacterium CG_4_9_14_3_um_filter_65_15]